MHTHDRQPDQGPAASTEAGRAHPVLNLLGQAGNRAVAGVLSGASESQPIQRVLAVRREPNVLGPVAVDTTTTDQEGNQTRIDGGHEHLTAIPASAGHVVFSGNPKPEALPANPIATFNALRSRCVAIAAEQLVTAESLRGDMKYWFAKVYHFVTKHELEAIDAGAYQYPLMKMQEVISFHATYHQNLEAWRAGQKDKVEGNWQAAFAAAESSNDGSWIRTQAHEIGNALLPSMEAHIRFDLPRAIAAMYEQHYAGLPNVTLADFHEDYNRMAPVFEKATADLRPEIQETATLGSYDPMSWGWLQDTGMPFMFDIPMERDHSWEKATTIVSGHQRGVDTQGGMQKRLEAYSTGAHPFSGSDDFDVDGRKISDYNWNNQPR
ncbi:hypothetical protein ALI144C_09420 [Actinosynnema sp. ALI-1.44]|uniref:DUF5995 family protein n=1 Tax=Actinosynnema sp. ALI-1.44 TaxID=1933779 RepID=UPI00097C6943|nr:DUF5995 family protein [Actinosynnema sp. ALI-1.44]ONI87589.1 hypothetical protein ALI144C_09420 [Actinosynnema sp. ALI-1.44]